jgi:RHS repeat-associated protein
MVGQPIDKTKGNEGSLGTNEFQPKAPAISLPKGGGAIRGMGEKFAANPVTGTGSMSVPIATSPGRSGFGPQLALSYDTGSGNGPFGFGWSLSLPSITRKTDKGLPKYDDAGESDVYILSGAEDLVPVLKPDGKRYADDTSVPGYVIHRYRPRIEGLYARIERWTNRTTGEIHWRSISRDNITTFYGQDNNSRVFDPEDTDPGHPRRIFSWLISESYDDKGNAIVYTYVAENDDNVDRSQANERNRTRAANRYLKRIRYGNRLANRDATTWKATDPSLLPIDTWMFEMVFDYGEGHYMEDEPDNDERIFCHAQIDPPSGSLRPIRQDPFSSYRAGFEVRTYRLCRRVLLFHHFPQELGIADCLVRSTEFVYDESPIASFITSVTQSGYVRQPDQTDANRYLKKSFPSVEFEYSQVPSPAELAQQPIREVDKTSLENLPAGLDSSAYQWVDLDGEGLSGILTEQADGWYYKHNLSANNLVQEDGQAVPEARFGPIEPVILKPNSRLARGTQFLDLAGNGQVDLAQMEGALRGFYERSDEAGWAPFRPFTSWPEVDLHDPDLRFVDLTGDGHADILITENETLTWYPSLAEAGFGPGARVSLSADNEKGPRLVFADGEQSIYLADLSGDGLSDLVRIRNGEVSYWPNLGYGQFGPRVSMDNAPHFDSQDQFDQQRIRLADTDGSGTTDILYLRRDGVQIYFNQSGNGWSDAVQLPQFPPADNLASVLALDLLGNGTACLVWSSSLPGVAAQPMRYLALMDDKPHLLVGVKNNLGAETRMQYAPSTKFYLADKAAGKPWITRLPFPVHVVERVETYDHISRNYFVTRYTYHHGYFDGGEREFRGFGMVEQQDTETFAAFTENNALPDTTNIEAASNVPPVLTRTWFHTGVYVDRNHVSNYYAGLLDELDTGEYYREPGMGGDQPGDAQAEALLLPNTVLPDGLTAGEEREACRALKGAMLRQEVYALDGTHRADMPYTVAEQNLTVECLQPKGYNRHAVFRTHPREAITYHYERRLAPVLNGQIVDEATAAANPGTQQLPDPRVQHALTLEVDDFGSVLKSAAIGYGRCWADAGLSDEDQHKQTQTLITYTENDVTNAIDDAAHLDDYRTPLPCETRTYELTGLVPESNAARFSFDEWTRNSFALPASATEIPYEQTANDATPHKRLIEQVRILYHKDDLTAFLPIGQLEPLALPGEGYKLALTPGLLGQVYQRNGQALLPDPASVLGAPGGEHGGYVDLDGDGHWWIPTGRIFFSPHRSDTPAQELDYARAHFFLPQRYRDPFDTEVVPTESTVTYDSHNLLMVETRDALGNIVTVRTQDDTGSTEIRNDYRVLQPYWVTYPNQNRTQVAFDALGMLVATAVMGKPGENKGDNLANFDADLTQAQIDAFHDAPNPHSIAAAYLKNGTTRIIYDLHRFYRSQQAHPDDSTQWEPPYAATLARETHVSDPLPPQGLKIQIGFGYSDGFGREIQKKVQAEPGKVEVEDAAGNITIVDTTPNLRWVGSGWVIYNNKGKPVRQYEPFFSTHHLFQFGKKVGVSPVLFYDPLDRVVATLHPDHTYEKVVFDPWQQTTYDVNDTVTFDPQTDLDVSEFFTRLPDGDYLPTWYAQRAVLTANDLERVAADKAAAHAGTPAIAYFDTLERPFLTVAQNKVVCPGHALDGAEEMFHTYVELDIEGNQRAVFDERKLPVNGLPVGALEQRVIMRYDYDMLGNRIHQASMEADERWMLGDVAGKPLYAWDSRNHQFRSTYDLLRRPTEAFLREGAGVERLVGRIIYGENHPNPETSNLRGKVIQIFDQAGVVNTDEYDFKGNLLHSQRQLAQDYKNTVDWLQTPGLENEVFTSRTTYDALNRPTQAVAPHSDQPDAKVNIIEPIYNEANLLEQVHAWLGQSAEPSGWLDPASASLHAVANIDYNARGQRELIEYGNGTHTTYDYDPQNFRLTHLITLRNPVAFPTDCPQPQDLQWPGCQVQNLSYTYDPVGNTTHIQDDAQQTVYFKNKRVEPSADYTYDAVYRLIQATGREHLGQAGGAPIPHSYNDAPRVGVLAPGDGNAMGTYLERYVYDAVGNFHSMQHIGSNPANPGWTRTYTYNEASLLEASKLSNRLSSTAVGNGNPEQYSYDTHGNMLKMPQLQVMQWDFRDELQLTQRQAVNDADTDGQQHQGERTYYVYDSSGQRLRKVTERQAPAGQTPTRMKERIYLGSFEVYREYESDGETMKLERETLHLMDDQQRVALIETRTQGSDGSPAQLVRFQYGNHLGSASLELDEQAQIISYEEYSPYGSSTYQAVRSQTETPKRYRYTGMERDEESGLNYQRLRYYAPWVGRWTSCDPTAIQGGRDLYQYGEENPLTYFDTNGKDSKKPGHRYYTGRHGDHPPSDQRVGAPRLQGHHPIQDKWARSNVAGYSPDDAPSQLLSTGTGEEHTLISNDQNVCRPTHWPDKSFSQARSEAVSQYENAKLFNEEKNGLETILNSDGYFFTLNDKVVKDPVRGKLKVIKNGNLATNEVEANLAGGVTNMTRVDRRPSTPQPEEEEGTGGGDDGGGYLPGLVGALTISFLTTLQSKNSIKSKEFWINFGFDTASTVYPEAGVLTAKDEGQAGFYILLAALSDAFWPIPASMAAYGLSKAAVKNPIINRANTRVGNIFERGATWLGKSKSEAKIYGALGAALNHIAIIGGCTSCTNIGLLP